MSREILVAVTVNPFLAYLPTTLKPIPLYTSLNFTCESR